MTKQTAITILAVFWLLSVIVGVVIGYNLKRCPECVGNVVVSVRDSTAPAKDTTPTAWQPVPKKVETRKYKSPLINNGQKFDRDSPKPTEIGENCIDQYNPIGTNQLCLDTNIYQNDTFVVDNFRATSTAMVTGNKLVYFNVSYQNFKPEKWKVLNTQTTVEKKQSLVKVYTGLYGGVAIQNKTIASYHGGIGLDAIISDRHLIGLQGGLNSNVQMEFSVRFSEKLRLKK